VAVMTSSETGPRKVRARVSQLHGHPWRLSHENWAPLFQNAKCVGWHMQ